MTYEDFKKKQINTALNPEKESVKRIQACFRLMNLADKESIETIFKVLKEDKCELVRHEAAFCLGETAYLPAIEVLKEVLEKDSSTVVKHECLISLGTIAPKETLPLIEKYIESENFIVSSSAIVAKERINQEDFFEKKENENTKEYTKKLIDILLDKNTIRNDKIQIMFILENIGTDEVVDAVSMILEAHSCPIVRHEAAFVLGEIGSKTATHELKRLLEIEKDDVVKHEILFALGTTGRKEALKTLKEYLNHPEYIVSESAKIAIDRIEILKTPYRGPEEFEYLNDLEGPGELEEE